jgi:hemolysin III
MVNHGLRIAKLGTFFRALRFPKVVLISMPDHRLHSEKSPENPRQPRYQVFKGILEPINTLSHAFGFVAAGIGLIWLLDLSDGDPVKIVAFSVYMTTMMLQYGLSAALHGIRMGKWMSRQLTRLDHAAIFLFIAGAFTPICLLNSNPAAGLQALGVIWAMAIGGVCMKLFWLDTPRWLSVFSYQIMVVIAYFAVYPFLAEIPATGAYWLALGGKFYLVGSMFYAFKRPNLIPGLLGHHELWHFFVLAGSACHYMVMLGYTS